MNLNIVTRCTRPENIKAVRDSIYRNVPDSLRISWKIIVDSSRVFETKSDFFSDIEGCSVSFRKGRKGDMGHSFLNDEIESISENEWIYFLDDDNEMHPLFLDRFVSAIKNDESIEGVIVSQYVGGKDFSGLDVRMADPLNTKVRSIDMAQFVLKRSLIGNSRFVPMTYIADGLFIQEIYERNPEKFVFLKEILSTYNSIDNDKKDDSNFLPRILVLGGNGKELKSIKKNQFESDDLLVKTSLDRNVAENIADFDPDCIVSFGDSYKKYSKLMSLSSDFRLRWIHENDDRNAGERCYTCAMNYILDSSRNEDLISVVTPVHNTGEKIRNTYASLFSQTFNNWEWVIIDDSDDVETSRIVESFEKMDPRVKVYDFDKKSGGIIGDVKYKGFVLSRGKWIVELDHDDVLTFDALEKVKKSFENFPDAGFVYSDFVETDENGNSLIYGETFAFGYGKYKKEMYGDMEYTVACAPNVNPVTIRHIVGAPNHLRAWSRDVYMKIGGHNRRLSIADDYELIVRTFLETRFVRIPKCCYIQVHDGNNTQDPRRSDIQRRVRSISKFYDEDIKKRFEELGKFDWSYGHDLEHHDGKENEVNYTL